MEIVADLGRAVVGLWIVVVLVVTAVSVWMSRIEFPPRVRRWRPGKVPEHVGQHVADALDDLEPLGLTLSGGFTFEHSPTRLIGYAVFSGPGPSFAVLQVANMDGRESGWLACWAISERYGEIIVVPVEPHPPLALAPPERGLFFRIAATDVEQTKQIHETVCRALGNEDLVRGSDDLVTYVRDHQLERMRSFVGRGYVERAGRVRPTLWMAFKSAVVVLPPVRWFVLPHVRGAIEQRTSSLLAGEVERYRHDIELARQAYQRRATEGRR